MKNIFKKFDGLSLGKQEGVNALFSISFAIPVLLIVLWGVDENGAFKGGALEWTVNFLGSIVGFYVAVLFLIPTFLFILLKAALFDTPKYKVFSYIAQFITGIFYTLGACIMVVSCVAPMHGVDFDLYLLLFGFAFLLFGFALFHIFQAAIQRTPTPQT